MTAPRPRRQAALLSVAVVLSACTARPTTSATTTTTTTLAPSTAPETTVTVARTTTTTLYQPSAPQPSEDQAGTRLLAAWRRADRAVARQDATPAAVDALFAQPYPAGGVQPRGCQTAVAGPSSCDYRIGDTLLKLEVVAVAAGWFIDAATFEG